MTKMDVMSINIHRMFEYLFCADESSSFLNLRFENDVKMYGTQTKIQINNRNTLFENDVVIAVLNENGHTGRVQICPFLHLCCSRHARGETPYTFLKAREKWRAFS